MGPFSLQRNKFFIGLVVVLVTFIYFVRNAPKEIVVDQNVSNYHLRIEQMDIDRWVQSRRTYMKNLSKLGEVLYLNAKEPQQKLEQFKILIWKYGPTIENRHLKQFSGKRIDPFEHCPVRNCDITYSDEDLDKADLVVFHLHRMKGPKDLPNSTRSINQIWAFLTDESPHHTFINYGGKLKDFDNVFNWSISYRSDSDIPVPYGRTILKNSFDIDLDVPVKRRDVLVAILGSNCGGKNHRWEYVKKLQKYIDVDVYGRCGSKSCPGHFGSDCPNIDQYMFYLSFENSNCNEYITEKLWWNAYGKRSIPIVMGSSQENYKNLLPIDSYLNVEDYANPAALAQHLLSLNQSGEYQRFYRWQSTFEVLNEHGYFGSRSYHYCRICQGLNYNSKSRKVYDNLERWWSVSRDCYVAWDQ